MRFARILSVAAIFFIGSHVGAYLLPPSYVINEMVEHRDKLRIKDLTATLTAEVAGLSAPVEERLFMKAPERLRILQERPEGSVLYVESETERASGAESSLRRMSGMSTDLLAGLLMPRGKDVEARSARVRSLLQKAGIDLNIVALGIYGEDVREAAYIVGAKPSETDKPQLWVDRVSFQPVRIITFQTEQGEKVRYETRMTGYGSATGGNWFPEVVENYRDGKLVRKAHLHDIRINDDLPESMFQVPSS